MARGFPYNMMDTVLGPMLPESRVGNPVPGVPPNYAANLLRSPPSANLRLPPRIPYDYNRMPNPPPTPGTSTLATTNLPGLYGPGQLNPDIPRLYNTQPEPPPPTPGTNALQTTNLSPDTYGPGQVPSSALATTNLPGLSEPPNYPVPSGAYGGGQSQMPGVVPPAPFTGAQAGAGNAPVNAPIPPKRPADLTPAVPDWQKGGGGYPSYADYLVAAKRYPDAGQPQSGPAGWLQALFRGGTPGTTGMTGILRGAGSGYIQPQRAQQGGGGQM